MQEIWKDIEGYEGIYEISNMGNVRSLTRKVDCCNGKRQIKGKILKPFQTRNPYLCVDLRKHQTHKTMYIHRLVANAFIPNTNNYPVINHIDNNPENNCVTNLGWCTQSYNVKYAYIKGNAKPTSGCFKKGCVPHNRKKINQYSKNGDYIQTFKSIREASKHIQTTESNINQCLLGYTKTAKGYIWKYAN